jgi:hypothetical protein
MIEHEQIEQQDFNTLIQIYKMQGLSDAWAQNKLYTTMEKYMRKKGRSEEANQYHALAQQAIQGQNRQGR